MASALIVSLGSRGARERTVASGMAGPGDANALDTWGSKQHRGCTRPLHLAAWVAASRSASEASSSCSSSAGPPARIFCRC